MPKVSVIIPTYNHRDYVLATLESVFAQTFTDYEVIVVNDGSPDDTAEVLKPYVKSGRIRYIEQRNQGQAAARNRGLGEASGEFFALLDDDDVWPADKLDWQVSYLTERKSCSVVGGRMQYIDHSGAAGAPGKDLEGCVHFRDLFLSNPFASPGQTLVRGTAIRSVGGFDESIRGADDLDLWMRLALVGGEIHAVSRLALWYRIHDANASKVAGVMLRNCAKVIKKHLPRLNPTERKEIERLAYRWVYRYAGKRVLRSFARGARRADFAEALHAAEQLFCLVRPALGDPRLLRTFARDLVRMAVMGIRQRGGRP